MTFGVSFGVCLEANANLASGYSHNRKLFEVLNLGLLPIFGEISSVLSRFDNMSCENSYSTNSSCLDWFTYGSSFIFLMIYAIIANILTLNLLIAIFR